MYPTKSAFDYMNEMNRLFPRTMENEAYHTRTASTDSGFRSPFQQTTSFNRSSSSADSLSPESFPDLHERQGYETPMTVRRQRPIVGRKIFDNTERLPPTLEPTRLTQDMIPQTWQPDDLLYPPTPPSLEQTKCNQNIFYELFPTENKGFEFKAPITPVSPGPKYNSYSPNYSPTLANSSPISVNTPYLPTSPFKIPIQAQNYGPGSSKFQDSRSTKMCTFCRKNGETPLVYMTHTVKEKVGHQNIVTCPILRSHVCSTCGASGDNAHTITYCPILRSNNNGQPLQSTTITLKNTRIKSNGRRRY
ncbi:uncharacterized protein LOC113505557 isoform X2 [Trichoplusia ni]|nr:uncharacterized protein LOC113505557 isoform X2 [Trichoplusia ni]